MTHTQVLSVSVILPIFNGETTIVKTLDSLFAQSFKFTELVIVDDASPDKSLELLREYLRGKYRCKIIRHKKNSGLAASYNDAIQISEGELVVTLHQDVVLLNGALEQLVAPFADKKVIASSHIVTHPIKVWNEYNFWQKCFFARKAGKTEHGIDGKFDCFRKSALFQIGLFDESHFKSAGEDADIVFRLKKIGKIVDTDAKIIHLHKIDLAFSWQDIVRKEAQYSEARGALLALGRIRGVPSIAKNYFREILLLGLAFPLVNVIFAIVVLAYSFAYTWRIFLKEFKNPRIILLPFFNIFLLLIGLIWTTKGFAFRKQTL
jgi:glycosyltransferase involved in cell wall biosynthesis